MNVDRYHDVEQSLWASLRLDPIEHVATPVRLGTKARVLEVGKGPPILFVHLDWREAKTTRGRILALLPFTSVRQEMCPERHPVRPVIRLFDYERRTQAGCSYGAVLGRAENTTEAMATSRSSVETRQDVGYRCSNGGPVHKRPIQSGQRRFLARLIALPSRRSRSHGWEKRHRCRLLS